MKIVLLTIISVYLIGCNKKPKRLPLIKKESKVIKGEVIATIDYESLGCFGGETYNLSIVKSEEETNAILKSENDEQTTVLDESKINSYNTFINELRTFEFGIGCTTEDSYSVKLGDEKIEKTDGGCSWNGFTKLKKSLFDE